MVIKNVLITGCNGQLGTEMQRLSRSHPQYHCFFTDHKELDITDRDAIEQFVKGHDIHYIVNCAAYTAVDKAEDEPEKAQAINADGVALLAAAMGKRGGSFVHISTDYVFNGEQCTPYIETDTVCPVSVYGKTKLQGEDNALRLCRNSMVIRTSWVYAATGHNFVKTMLRLGKERPELGVVFDQVGTPTFAGDLAASIYRILEHGIVPGIYHYSNEGAVSWYDFAKAIHRVAGINGCRVKPIRSEEYPVKAHRPSYSVLDKTRIKKTYSLEIPYWEDSLKVCIKELENKRQ